MNQSDNPIETVEEAIGNETPERRAATSPGERSSLAGALVWYLCEGVVLAGFGRPRARPEPPGPALPLLLVVLGLLLGLVLERLYIPGPAEFYAEALQYGWLGLATVAWVSLWLGRDERALQPFGGAGGLFCLLCALGVVIGSVRGGVYIALIHGGVYHTLGDRGWLVLAAAGVAWVGLAQTVLLMRLLPQRRVKALAGVALIFAPILLDFWWQPVRFWYPVASAEDRASRKLALNQQAIETQSLLLPQLAGALQPERPGVVDLYVLTFAPFGEEDVFRRESEMVAEVMQQRFDAQGRSLQLVNHPQSLGRYPWATPLNLKRAIDRVARRMNRDEDILFIHLTSHGAQDGELAAGLPPLDLEALRPAQLRAWLDEAGIRWRVLSISACYSGSWISPLADPGTLVLTAADAEHTSYGCGTRSELTFFGRAMYDEQLRRNTRSFESAHAAARKVIARREQEAGKDDGYSNPQIRIGGALRERLRQLEQRLEAQPVEHPEAADRRRTN